MGTDKIKELLELSHNLKPFVVGAEGNISQRIGEDILIKASGTSLRNLSSADLILCNSKGDQINNFSKKPSLEASFHRWILKFSNINFVAHTHPTHTLKILCTSHLREFATKRLFPDQIVFNGARSCVVPYATPGDELCSQIQSAVTSYVEEEGEFPKLILLQNHGIICASSSSRECLVATEICEKAAEVYWGSNCLGNPFYIEGEELTQVCEDENEKYRTQVMR